jgi:hypothetical protein
MKLSLQILNPEVAQLRLRGYKLILLGQILVMVVFLFGFELLSRYPFENWEKLLISVIGLLMITINFLVYNLLKELTTNKNIQYAIIILLGLGILIPIVAALAGLEPTSELFRNSSILSLASSLIAFVILLYFMVLDIFKEKHEISYRLWGSASIYLLFGAIFGLIYTLLELIIPAEFALNKAQDIFYFIPCYVLSFYTLSGIDSPFEEFSLLVKNITVIESIFANLYIVLVVGRLLAK